jgi:O-antigen ligase
MAAVGAFGGAFFAAGRSLLRLRSLVAAVLLYGLITAFIGIAPASALFLAGIVGAGATRVTFMVSADAMVQLSARATIRGRVVSLWLIDAWVQFATGHSLGGAPEAERLSGIFGADNLKLGPVLAVLSPFVLVAARAWLGRLGLLLAFLVVLVPVLLAGSRAAWLSFAIVCTVMAWREAGSLRRFAPMLVGIALAFVIAILGVRVDSGGFQARIERSLLAAEGTAQALDEASAGRVSIWRTAAAMIAEHPVTGVGARGFRQDYPDHAGPDDRFVSPDRASGAAHAHQIVLEVVSETGIVGLVFWLAGTWAVLRAWRRADAVARERAFAPALALLAMCFPLNTHLAFYSAWWGLLFWWLLALYCAALATSSEPDTSSAAALPA